jgi:phenylalanyl-tRNA synthetase beta chain
VKVSVRWLKQLVATDLDGAELARRLTLAGLEVEARTVFGQLSGVVVAEVRGKRPHPNAAKLTLVDVFDGSTVTQVVCGAPNVPEPGALVLWARTGARLPSGIELAAKEVRGVLSPGMLCAEDELGFGASHEGIIVLGPADGLTAGDDLAAKLGLPDEILEVNVTANRPDCLGHIGVAREVAALTGARLTIAEPRLPAATGEGQAQVELLDAAGCPRYTAVLLDGVCVGPSPLWLRLRLTALGMRPISNVVDATNLALLETGQPLHAFDLDQLAGHTIVVRRARAGEPMTTLDGVERQLTVEDVAICDRDRPVAVGGVMGGANSEVSPETRRLLLESAYFEPSRVRRTAKRLGLHTEASHRFERGVDPNGSLAASRRCAALLVELAGARVVGAPIDLHPQPIAPRTLTLRPSRTGALLGSDLLPAKQAELLRSIGLTVENAEDALRVTVPTFRPDLTREIDLIEEIARLSGYDRFPATIPPLRRAPGPSGDTRGARVRDLLTGLGLDEVVTFGFVGPEALQRFDPGGWQRAIKIQNPIREEQSRMRTTLIAGLVGALERNRARGSDDVALFEVGAVFLPTDDKLPDERPRVAGVITRGDFFDVKGVVEALLDGLGVSARYEAATEPWLYPRIQATLVVDGQRVGVVGELHPDLGRALAFEIDLRSLGEPPPLKVVELPRFPAVTRDLSFFVDAELPAQRIRDEIDRAHDPLLVELQVLEDYREPGKVPSGQKGMLWSFTYRAPDRTLTDAEVQALHEALVARLKSALALTLR